MKYGMQALALALALVVLAPSAWWWFAYGGAVAFDFVVACLAEGSARVQLRALKASIDAGSEVKPEIRKIPRGRPK